MGEKMDDLKGRAKEAAGDLTDNKDLQREGKVDQGKAEVKDKVGDVTDKIGDKIKDITD
jgi:uncharacterized protein YjbJ (UPF0337 family)